MPFVPTVELVNIEFRVVDNSSNTYRFLPTASGNYQDDADGKLYFFASGALATTVANLAAKISSVTALGVTATNSTTTLILSGSVSSSAYNGYVFQTGSGASFSTQATLGGGVNGIGSNALVLETLSKGIIMNSTSSQDSNGALASGSNDNIRWEIVSANTSSGTFSLIVRKGNDNNISKQILETWTNLSLDPLAPNYVSKVIGDQVQAYDSATNQVLLTGENPNRSRYIRVSSVLYPTPNYFDNNGVAKAQYTSSIPVVSSGSFGNAQGTIAANAKFYDQIITGTPNTQGVVGTDYTNMINLLANTDDYRFNVLLTPGLSSQENATQVTSIISNTENRGDNIYVVDLVPYDVSSTSTVAGAASSRDTSYAASYWPWVMVTDPDTGDRVWVPASTVIGGVYAKTDAIAEPWFAPAGINRGGLGQVIRAKYKLSQTDRDTLYQGKVNPIATFPGRGVVVYGQKTLQTQASALDRVNVRRLLIAVYQINFN